MFWAALERALRSRATCAARVSVSLCGLAGVGAGDGGDPARRHCGKGDSVGGFSSGSGRHGGGKEQGWGCSEGRGLVLGVGG